jgi:prophage maintenance system killer protein
MIFGGQELSNSLAEKMAALGFSLSRNHPFVDGNKRVGHAAIEAFLALDGYELSAVERSGAGLVWCRAACARAGHAPPDGVG